MRQIISYELVSDGTLHIVVREPSNAAYCTGVPVPDRITKLIFAPNTDGNIQLVAEVVGIHTPPSLIPEKFEFPS